MIFGVLTNLSAGEISGLFMLLIIIPFLFLLAKLLIAAIRWLNRH